MVQELLHGIRRKLVTQQRYIGITTFGDQSTKDQAGWMVEEDVNFVALDLLLAVEFHPGPLFLSWAADILMMGRLLNDC